MISIDTPYFIGHETAAEITRFSAERGFTRYFMVVDDHTYAALGQRLAGELTAAGLDIRLVRLPGQHVVADERTIVQGLLQTGDGEGRQFIACGSGTLTDITRFISHRTRAAFLSVPTAPSVDGYLSPGSPLVIGGLKQTVPGQVPLAIFCDLPTLQAAPRAMIAAGFGDAVGKLMSLADWRLGHVLWGEGFNEELDAWTNEVALECLAQAEAISRADAQGIRTLMEVLIKTGFIMVAWGSSDPASGAEHHLSHFLEMKLLLTGRPPILHGAKVGLATLYAARRYAALAALSRQELIDLLEGAALPDPAAAEAEITRIYGPAAPQVITAQEPFIHMAPQDFEALKRRILDNWDAVQAIAARLPSEAEFRQAIETVGGPTSSAALGITTQDLAEALRYAHYFRRRFTVNKLCHLLNFYPEDEPSK